MSRRKIALVGFHLYGGGGAKVMATLSNYFYDKNIDVHNIIFHDELGFDYSGRLFNLGKLKSRQNTVFNKIKRFNALKKYFDQHNFDFVIDFRFRIHIPQEYLISRFVYNRKDTIYTIHSSKLDVYLPKSRFWTNIIYGKAYRVLALTKTMEHKIKKQYPKLSNISTISNAVDIASINKQCQEDLDLNFEYIVAAGSYERNTKQFDKLIISYSNSLLSKQNIHLVILGSGKLLEYLLNVAKENKVEGFVHFLGYQPNPYKYFSRAKYFVLSSKFEGMPMVMIEALTCGIPVVSFNCQTGPKEVVLHKENGLLIEDQNLEELTKGLNLMILDEALYKKCKGNSLKSVEKFSLNVIGNQWLDVMNFKN